MLHASAWKTSKNKFIFTTVDKANYFASHVRHSTSFCNVISIYIPLSTQTNISTKKRAVWMFTKRKVFYHCGRCMRWWWAKNDILHNAHVQAVYVGSVHHSFTLPHTPPHHTLPKIVKIPSSHPFITSTASVGSQKQEWRNGWLPWVVKTVLLRLSKISNPQITSVPVLRIRNDIKMNYIKIAKCCGSCTLQNSKMGFDFIRDNFRTPTHFLESRYHV
jgi:hypothetical protein